MATVDILRYCHIAGAEGAATWCFYLFRNQLLCSALSPHFLGWNQFLALAMFCFHFFLSLSLSLPCFGFCILQLSELSSHPHPHPTIVAVGFAGYCWNYTLLEYLWNWQKCTSAVLAVSFMASLFGSPIRQRCTFKSVIDALYWVTHISHVTLAIPATVGSFGLRQTPSRKKSDLISVPAAGKYQKHLAQFS